MTFPLIQRTFAALLLCLLGIGPLSASTSDELYYDRNRASLIAYMLKENLSIHNFGKKKVDKTLSRNAFALYLRQLDPQKRFLLKSDVKKLSVYSDKIDEEIQSGNLELPQAGAALLASRVAQVRKMIRDVMGEEFDFARDDTVETDASRLDFCRTGKELRERWRKVLKYELLTSYLALVDDFKKEPADALKTAREKVMKSYDDYFARMRKEKKSEQYDRYLSAIARTFDPHTDYLPPVSKDTFEMSMRGSFEGIGATLREENGYIKVEAILPGSPAFRQGELQVGDLILKVAEGGREPVDIFDMRITDAVKLIRGKKGTEVRLTLKKQDGTQQVIAIVRDTVELEETFARSAVIRDGKTAGVFGYIKLPAFYGEVTVHDRGGSVRNATEDMKKELKTLESGDIKGLILDLRHNGGGLLADAVKIAGLFIGQGPVVQIRSSSGKTNVLSNKDTVASYRGPLVVLVDEVSASASEILAGALQDYGRAVIIGGPHTHGKGTVQRMVDLDDVIPFPNMDKFKPLGALEMTVQKFYRVTGESTQYKGIVPDIVLPDRLRCMKIGERYLDFALPWDKVTPVAYTMWSQKIDLRALRAKSEARVGADPDFAGIAKESDRVCERQKKTTLSVNIDALRKERLVSRSEMKGVHGSLDTDKKTRDDARQKEQDKKALWIDEVRKDPYVQEAMAALKDMMSAGE